MVRFRHAAAALFWLLVLLRTVDCVEEKVCDFADGLDADPDLALLQTRSRTLTAEEGSSEDSGKHNVAQVALKTELSKTFDRNCPSPNAEVKTISDLSQQYCNVFPTGNRNAASFRWFSFLADKATSMSANSFEAVSKGYCPISGSPIAGTNLARVRLEKVGGGSETGSFYFCCDPCICDMRDLVRVDTKTLTFMGGQTKQYKVLVHGDPCAHPDKLAEEFTDPFSGRNESLKDSAPEVQCTDGKLTGAISSDGGQPIIGVFFADPGSEDAGVVDGTTPQSVQQCEDRKHNGFNSGMGLIFRKVAGIKKI